MLEQQPIHLPIQQQTIHQRQSDLRQPDVIYNEPKESDNATVQLTITVNDRPTAGAVSDI